MKIITSYILKQLAIAMFITVLALGMMIWFNQSLRLLELVVGNGAPPQLFFRLALLTLPTFLGLILPIGLAIASLFTYHKLATESELTVMRSAGLSHLSIGRAAFILAIITAIVVFIIDSFLSPMASKEVSRLRYLARGDMASVLLEPGVFNDVGRSLTIYVRERTSSGQFSGVLLYDYRIPEKPATVIAEKGAIVDADSGPKVIVYNGNRQERDNAGNLTRLYFEQYTVDLSLFKETTEESWLGPDSRNLRELLAGPQTDTDRHFQGRLTTELHRRFANSLLPLSFVAIATYVFTTGQFNRRGQAKKAIIASVLLILLQAAFLGVTNFSAKHTSAIPLMYLLAALPAIVFYLMLKLRQA